MIWLVLRVFAGVALLLAAAAAAAFLVDSEGGVQVDLLGRSYPRLTLVESLLALAALCGLAWLVWSALSFVVDAVRFLLGDDAALSRRRARSRARRGHEALAAARVALADGDAAAADGYGKRVRRLLGERPLALMLEADVAEALGDPARAEAAFRALARESETASVGVRRLLAAARRRGERDRALKLARHLAKLRPRDAAARRILMALHVEAGDWDAAAAAAAELRDRRLASPDEVARLVAGLDLERARAADAAGDHGEAARRADAAAKAAPDFAPAVAFAALCQARGGETMRATRALRDAWRAAPRPEIAEAFADLAPDETPSARGARFAELRRAAPEHPLSRIVSAEIALLAGDAAGAREALGDPADLPRARRTAILRLALARAERAPEATLRERVAEALEAPDDPGWICGECGAPAARWRLVCAGCGALAALSPAEEPENGGRALDPISRALLLGEAEAPPADVTPPMRAAAGA